jgi:hypothetical protein
MGRRKTPPLVVGWREMVGLPALGVRTIKAKVDTGARTSAIHATRVRMESKEGEPWVRFLIHTEQRGHGATVEAHAPLLEMRQVRSSNGESQERPVIVTAVALGEREWPIELTLTARAQMGFRMLLGRTALRGHALVDPGRSFVASERPKKAPAADS